MEINSTKKLSGFFRALSTTKCLTKKKPILEQKPEYKLERKLFLSSNSNRKNEGGLRTKGYFKISYQNRPLISIVTVVYNGEKHLEQTIKSVIEQEYNNVEYIIIDGGSTDGTINIIKKYENQLDYWVSEEDDGVFYAMNQGLSLCIGDFVGFLNAGDYYNENILKMISSEIIRNNIDFFYSDENILSEQDDFLYIRKAREKGNWGDELGVYIPHQSTFINVKVHLQYPFKTFLKISSDRILFAELFKNNYKRKYVSFVIANFRQGGLSYNHKVAEKEFYYYDYRYYGIIAVLKRFIRNLIP